MSKEPAVTTKEPTVTTKEPAVTTKEPAVPTQPKIHLPAKAIAIAGRTGSGKSTLFEGSKLVNLMLIADTGSMGHLATFPGKCEIIDPDAQDSPIEQIKRHVTACSGVWALDSWSTFQEVQIMWAKGQGKFVPGSSGALKVYGEIVMALRDFAQWLAKREGIVIFNTATGGKTMNPLTKTEEETPAGCLTGLSSLSGVKGKEETILRAFSSVFILCQPVPEVPGIEGKPAEGGKPAVEGRPARPRRPRGFIVPGHDFRPSQKLIDGKIVSPADYAPIKDPLKLLRGTPDAPGIHSVEGSGCTIDAILTDIATRYPKR